MKLKEKNIAFILISSTVVALAYVGFSFYHTSVTSTLTEELSLQIEPIPGAFNASAIEAIERRNNVAPSYELTGTSPEATPTASIDITPSVADELPELPEPNEEDEENTEL